MALVIWIKNGNSLIWKRINFECIMVVLTKNNNKKIMAKNGPTSGNIFIFVSSLNAVKL